MVLGYPELLSHVCTLWREIILSKPDLWAYLDLFTLDKSTQTFLSRSCAFIPGALNRELTLRVCLHHNARLLSDFAMLKEFCSFISPRLKALSIADHSLNGLALLPLLLEAILPRTIPGTLTKLSKKGDGKPTVRLTTHADDDTLTGWELPPATALGISQSSLDAIVRPITSLKLDGRFFPWKSRAYHSLVELHLLCTHFRPFIYVSQLREILLVCPELRIFHIDINIHDQGAHQTIAPVPLVQLEELNLRNLSRNLYARLLPLLAPGPKPLQFTFRTEPRIQDPLYCPVTLSFFQRTNITSLYILGWKKFDQILSVSELLTASPANLHTLGLEHFQVSKLTSFCFHDAKMLPQLRLYRLYLKKCIVDVDVLKQITEILSVQVVKVHQSALRDWPERGKAQIRQEMASVSPTVKWVCSSQEIESWDAWEVEYSD